MAVILSARTKDFEQGLTRANTKAKKFGIDFKKIGKAVAKSFKVIALAAVAMATAVVAGMVAVTKAGFATVDSLAKTSRKLNITTEALASFRLAGKLAGIEARTLDMAIQRMTRRISEAAMGTGEA
ncbi:hypothetical protein LCGC14_0714680, partial [marine sediment metagenome]